jgi:hypothetical protein
LKAWKNSRRDLSWLSTIECVEQVTEASRTSTVEGWMTAREIFSLNHIPLGMSKKDNDKTLIDLLRECQELFSLPEIKRIAHENPLLVKYWYKKADHKTVELTQSYTSRRRDEVVRKRLNKDTFE